MSAGIVLTVAIQRRDPVGAGGTHAGPDRRALAAAPRMLQQADLGNAAARAAQAAAAVASVLPSSTKMISNGRCAASAAWISRASGSTFSASLQTGMTTESFMAGAQYTAAMNRPTIMRP